MMPKEWSDCLADLHASAPALLRRLILLEDVAEVIVTLASRFEIGARQTYSDGDPAGSTSEYIPEPRDLAVIEALVGRKVLESELMFMCGGSRRERFYMPEALRLEIESRFAPTTPEEQPNER